MRDYTKIARVSLSEAQYFPHLSHRLGYLTDSEAEKLSVQARVIFRCLHGLIQAVERESGKLTKWTAIITSAVLLALSRFHLST